MLNDAGNISSMKNEQKSQSWEYFVVIRLIVSAEKVKDIVSLSFIEVWSQINKFNPGTFHWSICTSLGKWTVIFLCVRVSILLLSSIFEFFNCFDSALSIYFFIIISFLIFIHIIFNIKMDLNLILTDPFVFIILWKTNISWFYWNFVESGVKHHKPMFIPLSSIESYWKKWFLPCRTNSRASQYPLQYFMHRHFIVYQ